VGLKDGENWLNDEIINGYIDLIIERDENEEASKDKKVFFNTYAYPKLSQLNNIKALSKFDRVLKRKKIDSLTSYDRLFFPINIPKVHWFLIVVNVDSCTFEFYDSIK
jgi:sentrin-specific protease 1